MKFLKSLDDRVFLAENKINCLNKLFLIKLKNNCEQLKQLLSNELKMTIIIWLWLNKK